MDLAVGVLRQVIDWLITNIQHARGTRAKYDQCLLHTIMNPHRVVRKIRFVELLTNQLRVQPSSDKVDRMVGETALNISDGYAVKQTEIVDPYKTAFGIKCSIR